MQPFRQLPLCTRFKRKNGNITWVKIKKRVNGMNACNLTDTKEESIHYIKIKPSEDVIPLVDMTIHILVMISQFSEQFGQESDPLVYGEVKFPKREAISFNEETFDKMFKLLKDIKKAVSGSAGLNQMFNR